MKLYYYPNCSSCRKAIKFLDALGQKPQMINIAEQAPDLVELKTMLAAYDGQIRKLFNTSGGVYRELNLKDKLPSMSEADALALLSDNGMLVKRPFLLFADTGLVGFKEELWQTALT